VGGWSIGVNRDFVQLEQTIKLIQKTVICCSADCDWPIWSHCLVVGPLKQEHNRPQNCLFHQEAGEKKREKDYKIKY
jgi:hypothetical protein